MTPTIGITGHAFIRWCERVAHVSPEGPDAPAARAALWAMLPELIEQGPDPSGARTVWIHPAHPGLAFIISRDVDPRAGCRVLVTVAPLVSGRGTAHIGKGPGRAGDRDSGRRERGGHWRPNTEDARLERVRVAVERQRERGRRTGRIGR